LLYDFVPNHTSVDSKLIEEHKDWFLYNENGKLAHPVSTWIDVGQLNHKKEIVWPYMKNVLSYWAKLGIKFILLIKIYFLRV
jgi:glycosidase